MGPAKEGADDCNRMTLGWKPLLVKASVGKLDCTDSGHARDCSVACELRKRRAALYLAAQPNAGVRVHLVTVRNIMPRSLGTLSIVRRTEGDFSQNGPHAFLYVRLERMVSDIFSRSSEGCSLHFK
jgi:hypothetical protein